jgi:hypothetical protein
MSIGDGDSRIINGAIVFMDLVKSTIHWRIEPNLMISKLKMVENMVTQTLQTLPADYCLIVKTIGDAIMMSFENVSILGILVACMQIQNKINEHAWPGIALVYRMGICFGQMTQIDAMIQNHKLKDYLGTTVNIASRMESVVSPYGGIAFCINPINSSGENYKLPDIFDLQPEHANFLIQELNKFGPVERFKYRNNCQDQSKLGSTPNWLRQQYQDADCIDSDNLKGVGELNAYQIKSRKWEPSEIPILKLI